MFRDFLIGAFGKLLQVIFVIAGIISFAYGTAHIMWLGIVGAVLCLCAVFGVRYAVGHIIRHRGEMRWR